MRATHWCSVGHRSSQRTIWPALDIWLKMSLFIVACRQTIICDLVPMSIGPGTTLERADRLAGLGIPMDPPIARLSGGQRAQVGLGLALAQQPKILLLDEPVAALDPLARLEFLASLTAAVADGDLSVVLSSHLLHDLERVCDHVILLASGHAQLCDEIESVLATHRMLVGPKRPLTNIEPSIKVVKSTSTTNQLRLVARISGSCT